MDRNTRALIVVLVALVAAGIASYGVYQAVGRMPVREVEVAHTFVVAAAKPIPTGARLKAEDVKLIAWPEKSPVSGSFAKIEAVVDRGVVAPLFENEPLTEAKLASSAAGAGLPPTIPPGMRAISVPVNEVVGVAGFVVPGTHVDVLVTLKQNDDGTTRVVVSNVQVLTAGTRYDQDKAKVGEAIPSSVVTLLLTPADAERVVLAAAEGQLMLALRNPLDAEPTNSPGTRKGNLFGASAPAAAQGVRGAARPKPAVVQLAAPPPPPPPAAAPKPYTVEAIRAAKRSEETVR
jgi:pilus assembly protein CpaB